MQAEGHESCHYDPSLRHDAGVESSKRGLGFAATGVCLLLLGVAGLASMWRTDRPVSAAAPSSSAEKGVTPSEARRHLLARPRAFDDTTESAAVICEADVVASLQALAAFVRSPALDDRARGVIDEGIRRAEQLLREIRLRLGR